jgi:hypothetical protein
MAQNLANYMDGWVAIGAWLQQDFDLGERVCSRLTQAQSERHGGILTGPAQWSGPPRYDLATAASCGRALLVCGRRDAAHAAGDFLADALTHQRDRARRLDLVFDVHWQALDPPEANARSYYTFDLARRGEKVWFPAFACAFLCELHAVGRDDRHLDAAREYYEFVASTPEFRDGTLANGKSGWSAGLLARATGEQRYRAALRRIAGNVLTRQAPDGEFTAAATNPAATEHAPDGDMPRRLERTAEFTTWSAEFLRMYTLGLMDDDG